MSIFCVSTWEHKWAHSHREERKYVCVSIRVCCVCVCVSHNGSIADLVSLVSEVKSLCPSLGAAPANRVCSAQSLTRLNISSHPVASIQTHTMSFVWGGKTHNWEWRSLVCPEALSGGGVIFVEGNELLYVTQQAWSSLTWHKCRCKIKKNKECI